MCECVCVVCVQEEVVLSGRCCGALTLLPAPLSLSLWVYVGSGGGDHLLLLLFTRLPAPLWEKSGRRIIQLGNVSSSANGRGSNRGES